MHVSLTFSIVVIHHFKLGKLHVQPHQPWTRSKGLMKLIWLGVSLLPIAI